MGISLLIGAITKSCALFSGKLIYKSNRKLFPVFAWPDINTRGVGRIHDSYASPQLHLGFAKLSPILPTLLVFISGYANTQNVFDCLNAKGSIQQLSIFTTIQVN